MPFEVTERNISALEPLFKPWEEPTRHRVRNPTSGQPALIAPGRRPSKAPLVRAIRAEVDAWRRGGYAGVSETSRYLLTYWFESDHFVADEDGNRVPFRYHWAQREATETIVYLAELRRIRGVAELLFDFGSEALQDIALGIPPEEDRWLRACCKVATGGGKTKIMSLAIVWSYFHSLYEPGSDMPRHFVLIAPNLIVYERLKDDFENCAIFYRDPLIPEEWKNDFQMQVVLQDEPGGATTTGAIYLTNIHRLYPSRDTNDQKSQNDASSIFGPAVVRGRALDTGEDLRRRIASHPSLMVLNDEAHHLHDPDLAWNKALDALHSQSTACSNNGIRLQLDFTATPKHTDGTLFRHIICDFPLGEAVDAGIVKVPVLGEAEEIVERGDKHTPADKRFAAHLEVGYRRYAAQYDQLSRVRKPILFVMTEDAKAANEVAAYLDSDQFPLLKGHVLNIHTRLKGRVVTVKRGGREIREFVENEKDMKPDDLRALPEMSRELDRRDSKFRCVVSVMMLREGWDVRNVTTIVPLRPYSAAAGILPEQTLGRGLRRMFPLGDTPESVIVVHHPAFRRLYEEELEQEGLDIAVLPERETLKQTVSIYVDRDKKPVEDLDIEVPSVSDAVETRAELQDLSFDEIRQYFRERFAPLPIGTAKTGPIEYVERHLFTDEIIARLQLDAGLLTNAWSAPSYFAQQIGRACHLTNAHALLTPLIERFLAEVLFERPVDLYSGEVDHRMRDADVMEHVQATFAPLILQRTVHTKDRKRICRARRISTWKPYQATSTRDRPAVQAKRSMFNLVPCENQFEQEFVIFCDYASDVAAFVKNAGPQKLTIDYLRPDGHGAMYWPDFLVRLTDGSHLLVELKGKTDSLVPRKARAAVEWCRAASDARATWRYVFVPYHLFQQSSAATADELARACEPALQALLKEAATGQQELPLWQATAEHEAEVRYAECLEAAGVESLPDKVDQAARQAVQLLHHAEQARMPDLAHAFQPLLGPLDDYAIRILEKCLIPMIPGDVRLRRDYFGPYLDDLPQRERVLLERNGRYLEQNLVFGRSIQKLGTLLFCIEYATQRRCEAPGIWKHVAEAFSTADMRDLYADLRAVNEFRNTRVAHIEKPLDDPAEAREAMKCWLRCLSKMSRIAGG